MNDLPKRKQLRLKHYDYSQNGVYYITICTYNKQELFGAPVCSHQSRRARLSWSPECSRQPYNMIEKWLLELENKFKDVKICKYVIMPDHIHFIVSKTGDHIGSPLQDIVGWFKTMTSNEYIKCVRDNKYPTFDKAVWQRGYYEHVIRNESDYLTICEYIENNPSKKELGYKRSL